MKASAKEMTDALPPNKQQEFKLAFGMLYTQRLAVDNQLAFTKLDTPEKREKAQELHRKAWADLDGKTADQLIEMSRELSAPRASTEQLQSMIDAYKKGDSHVRSLINDAAREPLQERCSRGSAAACVAVECIKDKDKDCFEQFQSAAEK